MASCLDMCANGAHTKDQAAKRCCQPVSLPGSIIPGASVTSGDKLLKKGIEQKALGLWWLRASLSDRRSSGTVLSGGSPQDVPKMRYLTGLTGLTAGLLKSNSYYCF